MQVKTTVPAGKQLVISNRGQMVCIYPAGAEVDQQFAEGALAELIDAAVPVQIDWRENMALATLAATDLQMARVVEDLIDVLVDKGVIKADDLPTEALDKLSVRQDARSRIAE